VIRAFGAHCQYATSKAQHLTVRRWPTWFRAEQNRLVRAEAVGGGIAAALRLPALYVHYLRSKAIKGAAL
jgi:hypothetical protein